MPAVLRAALAQVDSPVADEQFRAVRSVLDELGCQGKPELTLLNKMDAVDQACSVLPLVERLAEHPVRISARSGQGLAQVVERVRQVMRANQVRARIRTAAGNGKLWAFLASEAEVIDRRFQGDCVEIEFRISRPNLARLCELNGSFERLSPWPLDE